MSICAYQNCETLTADQGQLCILHVPDEEKQVDQFRNALIDCIRRQLNSAGPVIIDGVVFPRAEFDLSELVEFLEIPSNRRELEIRKSVVPDTLLFQNTNLSGLHIHHSNQFLNLKVNNVRIGTLRVADLECEKFEISGSHIERFFITSYLAAEYPRSKILRLLIVASDFHAVQAGGIPIDYVNIRATTIHHSLDLFGLSSESFLVHGCAFAGEARFEEIQSKIFVIAETKWRSPESISILRCNLSWASFAGTNISHLLFVDNNWRLHSDKQIMLLEHKLFHNHKPPVEVWGSYRRATLGQLAETYRQLKTNFESRGNYIDAGNFHYSEMEMRRLAHIHGRDVTERRSALNWRNLSILSAYKLLSGYGESPRRAFLVLLGALALFSWLHLWVGFTVQEAQVRYVLTLNPPFSWPSLDELSSALRLSFANLTLRSIKGPMMSVSPVNTILWILETLFGPLQFGLLVLAIKRKIRR